MDYKNIFWDYIKDKVKNGKSIDLNELREMSKGYEDTANNALYELIQEGTLEGKFKLTGTYPGDILNNYDSLYLTKQGINKIAYDDYMEKYNKTNVHSAKSLAEALMSENKLNLSNITNAKQLNELLADLPNSKIPLNMDETFTPEQIVEILKNYGYVGKTKKQLESIKQNINALNNASEIVNTSKKNIKKAQNLTKGLSQIMNEPDSTLYKELIKPETYTFEGILGQNCGKIIPTTGEDIKRLQVKGYKIKDGIRALRGFANSSKLAEFSKIDENYQRDKNDKHLNSLVKFVEKIKESAKYLPEVTLVARGYEKLTPISISGNLSQTQQGEIENLNLWQLTVTKEQLYRIDGNHRLEATKNKDLYIPFSIILWEENDKNSDDEAFLFYFLNSKSKKLSSEENLKGLVNAQSWKDYELKNANVLLPYIKYFRENFEDNKLFQKEHYKDSEDRENTKIQILKILEIILNLEKTDELSFDLDVFGDYISKTQEILSQRDRFKYLREHFRCLPQFIFYTIYQNKGNIEESIQFITEVNKWAEYYKHDSNSFILPDKMYHNAKKQLDKKINIFVAMPYYDEATVEQFNKTMQEIVDDLRNENVELKEKLNLYPIMTYKAESTDILANMDKQIGDCDIFIADISNHGKNKVNPNVMFELERVYDKTKFILIRNKNNKVSNSAFDIQHYSYETIDFGMGFDACMKTKLKPRILNIIKDLIGC